MKPRRRTRAQASALADVERLLAEVEARIHGCARLPSTTTDGAVITFLADALLAARLKRERVQQEGGRLEVRLTTPGPQLLYVGPGAP